METIVHVCILSIIIMMVIWLQLILPSTRKIVVLKYMVMDHVIIPGKHHVGGSENRIKQKPTMVNMKRIYLERNCIMPREWENMETGGGAELMTNGSGIWLVERLERCNSRVTCVIVVCDMDSSRISIFVLLFLFQARFVFVWELSSVST